MNSRADVAAVEPIEEASRAELLLHPLRQKILSEAREASTAAEIARRMGLAPQKVNYHVRTLVEAGLLHPAGEGRKRNLVEKRYRASARSYVLLPSVLGDVDPTPATDADRFSAAYLMQLCALVQREVAAWLETDRGNPDGVPTLSLEGEVRFESAEQRAAFAEALEEAFSEVVAEHTSPALDRKGRPGKGEAYRAVLCCYPVPEDTGGSTP